MTALFALARDLECRALEIQTHWIFGLAWRLRLERVRRGERDPFFALVQ